MIARSLLVAGLFFQMTLVLEAQYPQSPRTAQLTPQQRQMMKALQKQGMQPGMQGMQGGVPFEASGTLEAIGSGRIKITDAAGTERIISFNQQTTMKTTGEATAEFLRPGLCVEFKAEVDAKGNVTGKVDEVSVVTATKDKPIGVFPEGGGEAVKPALGSGGKKEKVAAAPAGMSKVVGHIKSVKSGKYLIQAGHMAVQFELGENPKISIDMADGTLASKGDKIEVKGLQMPNMPNQAQAQSVTITLKEPLGEKKKGEAGKFDPKHPPKALKSKNSDKAEGLPAPAMDK